MLGMQGVKYLPQPTKEAGASNEAGRASASTTYLLHRKSTTIPPLLAYSLYFSCIKDGNKDRVFYDML
jgi:hypothetical protein